MRKFQIGDEVKTIDAAADWDGDHGQGKDFRAVLGRKLIVYEIGDFHGRIAGDRYYVKVRLPEADEEGIRYADKGISWEYCPEYALAAFEEDAPHVWAKGDRVRIARGFLEGGRNPGLNRHMKEMIGNDRIYVIESIYDMPGYKGVRLEDNDWAWTTDCFDLVPDNEWHVGEKAYVVGVEEGYGLNKRRMHNSKLPYEVLKVGPVLGLGNKNRVHLRDPETGRAFIFSEDVVSHYADGPRKVAAARPKPPEEKEEEVEARLRKEFDDAIIATRKEYQAAGGATMESLCGFYLFTRAVKGKKLNRVGSLTQPCHYALHRSAGEEVLGGINFLTRYATMKDGKLNNYRRYLDYVLNRGHAKNAFYRTSVDGAIENGLRYNVERGANELALASVAVRMGTEFQGRLGGFGWALDNGYSENVAAAIFHCTTQGADGKFSISVTTGHSVMRSPKKEDYFKFFSDKYEFPKEEPYRLVNRNYSISILVGEDFYEAGISEDINKLLKLDSGGFGANRTFDEKKLKVLANWFKEGIENV